MTCCRGRRGRASGLGGTTRALQAASASCLLLLTFGSSTAEPRFAAPFRSFAASGFDPHAVAVADFDRDGILDVAVAHASGPISVHLGDGNGSLGPPIDSPGSSIALGLAAVDLDADGVTDLLTANWQHLGASHGNGDGSFASPDWFRVVDCYYDEEVTCYNKAVTSFATGDVDADGDLDAIVIFADLGSYDPGALYVLRGTGAGRFSAAAASYEVGAGVQSLVLADFDGDARLDVATANGYENSVSVLLGSGDGTFGVRNDFPTPSSPRWVDAGDFDGDGWTDLATAGEVTAVLRGRGDGSFEPGAAMAPNGVTLAAVDVNRDQRLDLLVWSQGDAIAVLLGRGDAAFDRAADVIAGAHPRALAAGDLDGDGILDLVAANRVSRTISVHHGNGDGSFGTHTRFPAGETPQDLVIADPNLDGNPDLVVQNMNGASLSLWPGRGGGDFGTRRDFFTGNYPTGSLALADLNRDGALDAVLPIQWHKLALLLGDGLGGFTAPLQIDTGWDPKSVAGGDVDGDSDPDLVVSHRSGYSIHLGNGDGTFQPRSSELFDNAIGGPLLLVDLNGDSRLDLVLSRYDFSTPADPLTLRPGQGDGTFGPRTALPTDRAAVAIVAADVDGDDAPDLVTADINTDRVSVLLGNGDGTFQTAVQVAAARGASDVAVGELDGDGHTDLVIASSTANTVSLLSGNGGTSFGDGVDLGAGRAPASLALADLNGDGRMDLATADAWSNTITLLWNLSGNVPVDVQETGAGAATRLHRLYDPGGGSPVPIGFSLALPCAVRLTVYDARGALVRTLTRETLGAGQHTLDWDRRDRAGLSAPRAVYFVRLEAGRFVTSRKLVLLHRAP